MIPAADAAAVTNQRSTSSYTSPAVVHNVVLIDHRIMHMHMHGMNSSSNEREGFCSGWAVPVVM
jgi:hypothetical protein